MAVQVPYACEPQKHTKAKQPRHNKDERRRSSTPRNLFAETIQDVTGTGCTTTRLQPAGNETNGDTGTRDGHKRYAHHAHELAIRVSNHPYIVVWGSLASSWAALHARMLPFLCGFCLSRHHLRTHGKTGDGHLRIWASTYGINGFHRTVRPSCSCARATVKQLAIRKILNLYCAF